jgi:hypothetical protein
MAIGGTTDRGRRSRLRSLCIVKAKSVDARNIEARAGALTSLLESKAWGGAYLVVFADAFETAIWSGAPSVNVTGIVQT